MSEDEREKKVYRAQGGLFSIHDLLRSFADPELEADGISLVSDIHLKVGEPVRYRYKGSLESLAEGEPLTDAIITSLIFPLIQESQRAQVLDENGGDVDAGYFWEEQSINFRLNIFRDRDGIACVVRMLPKVIPDLDEIGFLNESLWETLVELRQGLILVTGVTGSGKSTTIASILDSINKRRKVRIITLEDPIEYVFQSEQSLISQREIGKHLSDFPSGLRSALRENPDIIYVGEIRDAVTAQLALSAAETGHVVLTTLHTKDVKGSFSRLLDMFPAERSAEIATQLSFSIAYVISQKLLNRKDGEGRVPVFEILKNNPAVGHLIRTSKLALIQSKIEAGSSECMNTLEQHLIELVKSGAVTKEEAIVHANDPSIVGRLD